MTMPDFGRWTANGGDPSLNAIARSDKFLDALAAGQSPYSTDPGEAELAYLLAGWRDDVREHPDSGVVSPRDAVEALRRGVASRRRTRMSLAVVGSVAAALLCLGGFGAAVYGAGPGDALYGLRTTLFGEQQATRDDQVVLAAQTQLAEVEQLINEGQWTAAQDKLQTLTTTVATVNDVERKQELADQLQELSVKVETRNPNATVPPGAPPLTLPSVPAVVEPTTTPTTTPTTSPTTTPTTTESPTTTTTTTTTTSPPETTTSTTTNPPVQQPPPPPTTTTTTPTTPPTTTTTTTTPTTPPTTTATTTTTSSPPPTPTTTTTTVAEEPAAGDDSDAVESPTSAETEPRLRGEEDRRTARAPVTTTTVIQPRGSGGG